MKNNTLDYYLPEMFAFIKAKRPDMNKYAEWMGFTDCEAAICEYFFSKLKLEVVR